MSKKLNILIVVLLSVAVLLVVSGVFTWILVDKYLPDGVNIGVEPDGVRGGFQTDF